MAASGAQVKILLLVIILIFRAEMSGVINKITVSLFSIVFSSICDTPGSTFAVEVGRYFDCQNNTGCTQ